MNTTFTSEIVRPDIDLMPMGEEQRSIKPRSKKRQFKYEDGCFDPREDMEAWWIVRHDKPVESKMNITQRNSKQLVLDYLMNHGSINKYDLNIPNLPHVICAIRKSGMEIFTIKKNNQTTYTLQKQPQTEEESVSDQRLLKFDLAERKIKRKGSLTLDEIADLGIKNLNALRYEFKKRKIKIITETYNNKVILI